MSRATTKPSFLITIDTEGDNLWSKPDMIRTENARFIPRFQELCESYGLKPTYLTTHEMALSPEFQDFGRDVLQRSAAEIGMHLHAWNSPPVVSQTDNDFQHQPYLREYPPQVMRDKIAALTDTLAETFGTPPVSHRAGRWAFDEGYARLLLDHGYRVDCSVTPHVSWQHMPGDPNGQGGSDYRHSPQEAYFVNLDNVSVPGCAPLLEIPVTIRPVPPRRTAVSARRMMERLPVRTVQRAGNRLFPEVVWLRPNGRNLDAMLGLVKDAVLEQNQYLEFMLHSSELMPGGSPTFHTSRRIERLYDHLQQLFAAVAGTFRGQTLREFHNEFSELST